jgi:hypothetical protein
MACPLCKAEYMYFQKIYIECNCPLCLQDHSSDSVVALNCGHVFGIDCIKKHIPYIYKNDNREDALMVQFNKIREEFSYYKLRCSVDNSFYYSLKSEKEKLVAINKEIDCERRKLEYENRKLKSEIIKLESKEREQIIDRRNLESEISRLKCNLEKEIKKYNDYINQNRALYYDLKMKIRENEELYTQLYEKSYEDNTYEINFPKPIQIPRRKAESVPFELLDPPYKPNFILLNRKV